MTALDYYDLVGVARRTFEVIELVPTTDVDVWRGGRVEPATIRRRRLARQNRRIIFW